MATQQENLARFQEISNRGLQDQLPPDKRAIFDEAVSRGLVQVESQDFPGASVIEPALTVASSIPATVLSGIEGARVAATEGLDEGVAAQEGIASGLSFTPRTQAGKEGLETLGKIVDFGIDVANIPISGLAGMVQMVTGGSLEDAVNTINAIQKEGLGETLGGKALDATGSPELATLAHILPDAALEVLGLKGVGTAFKGTRKAADMAVPAAKKAVPAAKKVAIAGKELAEDVASIKTPARKEIARQLQTGEINKDIARFKLSKEGVKDPTEMQKILGLDSPKVVADKPLINASNQGFDEGFLETIKKTATTADRQALAKMTAVAEKGRKNPVFGDEFRPSFVAGDVLLKKVNEIKAINRLAGKQIGRSKKFLKGQKVPVAQIGDSFLRSLDDLKIGITEGGKLDFKNALVSGAGRKKAIADIFERMSSNKSPDALDLHELKQFIDETVSYGKTVRGLGGNAERSLKDLRSNIKTALDKGFPKYAEANKAYSDTIQALDEIQNLAGKKTDLTSDTASGQLAILARRITSNAQSRGRVKDSFKQIEDVLKEHTGFGGVKRLPGSGGDGTPDFRLLMKYADELDKVAGSKATTSLAGGVETAIKATRGPKEFIADKAVEAARKASGISEEGAYKSMLEFLSSQK